MTNEHECPFRISPTADVRSAIVEWQFRDHPCAMASSERILVINPNSTQAVTDGIDRAMAPLRMAGGPTIECVTLKEGPPGIETQAHFESVVAPIDSTGRSRDTGGSGFLIA